MKSCINPLIKRIQLWGRDKGINNPKNQLNKVIEEVGEIAHEITRDKIENNPDLADAIGDTLVTVFILADICGYDVQECLIKAYNEIVDRKGRTIDGNFIKETNDSE